MTTRERVAEDRFRTTTAEALLGMLSLRPMSGYEIRQAIEGSIGNFWRESYGQIYPTLKRLVADGLAEGTVERGGGAGRSARGGTRYALTGEGRKRLRAWLNTPSTEQVPRNEMLLKIFFAGQASPGAARRQVKAFGERHRLEMERFAGIRRWLKKERAGHPDRPYWEMTLEFGRAESKTYVRWSERMLRRLNAMKEEER